MVCPVGLLQRTVQKMTLAVYWWHYCCLLIIDNFIDAVDNEASIRVYSDSMLLPAITHFQMIWWLTFGYSCLLAAYNQYIPITHPALTNNDKEVIQLLKCCPKTIDTKPQRCQLSNANSSFSSVSWHQLISFCFVLLSIKYMFNSIVGINCMLMLDSGIRQSAKRWKKDNDYW